MALVGSLCVMVHAVSGFTNKILRSLVAGLLGADYTANQMTYDLRRLRLHGLIQRVPHTNTYVTTPAGLDSESPSSTPRSTIACSVLCSVRTDLPHPRSSVGPWPPSTALLPATSQEHASRLQLETCHNVTRLGPRGVLAPDAAEGQGFAQAAAASCGCHWVSSGVRQCSAAARDD